MQRLIPILIATVAVLGLAAIFARSKEPAAQPESAPRPSAAVPVAPAPPAPSATEEPAEPLGPPPPPAASVVPKLPDDAPKSVGFGVILIAYEGAQLAPKGAPSRAAALEKATKLLEEAKTSFEEAAKKGDPGSRADAGKIPRGVLEPAVEYALFTLKKGEIASTPIDTPRGFWIVRRNN